MNSTKFVLHGGQTSLAKPSNTEFFRQADSGDGDQINILCLYPHRDPQKLDELFERNQKQFTDAITSTPINFDYVYDDPKDAAEKLKWATTVYVPGGNTFMIMDLFRATPGFEDLIAGKAYLGSSGGAYAVCEYFYENAYPGVYKGLGYVPLKIIGHYMSSYARTSDAEWSVKLAALRAKGIPDMEVLALHEAEYRVCVLN